jgi:hypothetical protein
VFNKKQIISPELLIIYIHHNVLYFHYAQHQNGSEVPQLMAWIPYILDREIPEI